MGNGERKCGKTADVFKPLDEILLPDPRQRFQTLEDFHTRLSRIEVHAGVPKEVHVSFNNARNLYLYSWFVYRFRATAEFQAYAALELALRMRINPQTDKEARKFRGLRACLDHALKNGWFADKHVRRYQRLLEALKDEIESSKGLPGFQDPRKFAPDAWVQRLSTTMPTLRNPMAHGRLHLMTGALETLEICCDLIHQLFPSPPTTS